MSEREDSLCDVIRRAEEARDLDYKGPCSWDGNDKRACCEIVKDILALANTQGGHIVIGVTERDGRFAWEGLTDEEIATWETTKVNNFVQRYAEPPINVLLRKPACDDRQYVVLTVPRFPFVPHVTKIDYPGVLPKATLYVRTANNESAPLQSAQDFHHLIEHAVRLRRDQMLEAMRSVLTGASLGPTTDTAAAFGAQADQILGSLNDPFPDKNYEAYFTHVMFPERFDSDRFSLADLWSAVQAGGVTYRDWPFLFQHNDRSEIVVENDGLRAEWIWSAGMVMPRDQYLFWNLKQSGLVVQKSLVGEAAAYPNHTILEPRALAAQIGTALAGMVAVYETLGLEGEFVTWQFRIDGTQGRELHSLGNYIIRPGRICQIPFVTYNKTLSIEDWKAGLVEHAAEAMLVVLQRFGWQQGEGTFVDWMQRLYARDLR